MCAGMGSFALPGASSFLSSLKESYQRKPLETTFQDFLARECAGVAPAGASLRRPHFFLRRKKCGKESRLDLRSKGPLARCGSCRFGGVYSRAGCSSHHCRSKGLCLRSPARRLTRPLAPATVGVFSSAGLGEFRRRGGECIFVSDGDNFAPAGAGWGVSCSGTSNFLLLSKESYQRKPLKPTV